MTDGIICNVYGNYLNYVLVKFFTDFLYLYLFCFLLYLSTIVGEIKIFKKRLTLGLRNFHHTVAPNPIVFKAKFHSEILTGSPSGWKNKQFSSFKRLETVEAVGDTSEVSSTIND